MKHLLQVSLFNEPKQQQCHNSEASLINHVSQHDTARTGDIADHFLINRNEKNRPNCDVGAVLHSNKIIYFCHLVLKKKDFEPQERRIKINT